MTLKTLARSAYHVLPRPWRQSLEASPTLGRLHEGIASNPRLHNWFYDRAYYDSQLDWLDQASEAFADQAITRLRPASVLDVGCGQGCYLAAFAQRGIQGSGVELAEEAWQRCRQRGLNVDRLDLTRAPSLPAEADLVYSIEVAEHLPQRHAEHWVSLLCRAARRWVVITAAAPGQSGKNHFNCQPKAYWAQRFEGRGFRFEPELTDDWQHSNAKRGLPGWLRDNLLVLRRAA